VQNTESLPERVVQLVMEPPPPPPPPPPKPEKPLEKAPVSAKPTPAPVDPRVKANKSISALSDDLAALRDVDLDKFSKNQPKTTDPGDVSVVQRSLITNSAGGTSGGISAPTSSGLAAGSGSLNGIRTAQIKDPNLAAGGHAATRAGGSGKASRGSEEIALVFTKNKGAIDDVAALTATKPIDFFPAG